VIEDFVENELFMPVVQSCFVTSFLD